LRLTYLAPDLLKRLTCGREASAVSLYDLCFLAGEAWGSGWGERSEENQPNDVIGPTPLASSQLATRIGGAIPWIRSEFVRDGPVLFLSSVEGSISGSTRVPKTPIVQNACRFVQIEWLSDQIGEQMRRVAQVRGGLIWSK
jgi:hypothetical protein